MDLDHWFHGILGRDLVQEWTADGVIPATSRDADIRDIGTSAPNGYSGTSGLDCPIRRLHGR